MGRQDRIIHLIVYAIILIFTLRDAFSYVDPGTGGMIFNSFWMVIVGIFGVISAFIGLYLVKPVKKWIKRLRKRNK